MNFILSKKLISLSAKNTILIIFGTTVLAFGTAVFILPFNIVAGGVSGLGIIISSFVPSEVLSKELIISLLAWSVFFAGLFVLGRSFAVKTLTATVVYSIMLNIFSALVSDNVLDGFFVLNQDLGINLIIASIFGGFFVGLGCSLTFIGGGSTGGTDIIAFMITKCFKRLKSSAVIGVIDALIVIVGMLAFKNFILSLLGILTVFITTAVIDKVFVGAARAFVAQIVTETPEKINQAVICEMKRTSTLIKAVGGYSGREETMLLVSFSIRQYSQLLRIISEHDKNAFVTVYRAHEINGLGWKKVS